MTTQRDTDTDDPDPNQPTGTTDGDALTRDGLLAIALVAKRRRLIRHLNANETCDIGEAVRAVGDDPNESHIDHEDLKDAHLPLLERFGVVDFDGTVIRPGPTFELAVGFVWDLVDSFEAAGIPPHIPDDAEREALGEFCADQRGSGEQ